MPSEPRVGWQFLLATLEHARAVDAHVILLKIRCSEQACGGRIPVEFRDILEIITVDVPLSPPFFRWHYPRFTRIERELWVRSAAKRIPMLEQNFLWSTHITSRLLRRFSGLQLPLRL